MIFYTPLTSDDVEKPSALAELVDEVCSKSKADILKQAQETIARVENGDAAGVGLEQTAVLSAVTYEIALSYVRKVDDKRMGTFNIAGFQKACNILTRLHTLHKQSGAWAFREQNRVKRADGLGRNDSRVEARILRRGTSTAEGVFDKPL